jgi:lysophospholipase L1-like esterase
MIQLACLGDSNTFGYDPQSLWGGRYEKTVRWTGRLEAAGFTVRNFGVNGLGVSRESVHTVLAGELKSLRPPVMALVMLGSNDLLLGVSAAETARCMERLLALISEKRAADAVCLIAPAPFRPGTWVQDAALIPESRALAERYCRLAEEKGLLFADAGAWNIPLAFDGVHFTEEGHRIFAERLEKVLREAVLPLQDTKTRERKAEP